jgi:hypothetical protein
VKKILIDAGTFYTKVYVLVQVSGNGGQEQADRSLRFFGRSFFPTLVSRTGTIDKSRLYYEHEGALYAVGYDGGNSLSLEEIFRTLNGDGIRSGQGLLILKKILFDYADHQDDLEVEVIVDSYRGGQVFEELGAALGNRKIEISAFRGYDQRLIKKEVTIKLALWSSGDAVEGFLEKNEMDFGTALVVDVGYSKTKIYVVDCEKGIELFKVGDFGVSLYYEKMMRLFAEEKIEDNHFLWLVKQVELGCQEVETRRERLGARGKTATLADRFPRYYDISLVMENVRWDLNKEFKRFTTDILTSYYTTRMEWTDMLVVTGGGASLNGDILRLSLVEGGYCFNEVYIEKQPIYTLLEGACQVISAP